jgi:hypothetical protein
LERGGRQGFVLLSAPRRSRTRNEKEKKDDGKDAPLLADHAQMVLSLRAVLGVYLSCVLMFVFVQSSLQQPDVCACVCGWVACAFVRGRPPTLHSSVCLCVALSLTRFH